MKLTPLDIRKQEFRKVIRGYDSIEVDTFLEMVADEYESLVRSKSEWNSKLKRLEDRLKEYQEIEKTLQKTLMEAQNSFSKSKEDSKKEAELIIKEAEITANKIIEDSSRESARLKNEIMLLKTQKESLAIRLKHILNSQIELIKILELDESQVEEFKRGEEISTDFYDEKLNQIEKDKVNKKKIVEQLSQDKNIGKKQKIKTTEKGNDLFGVVGSKGEKKADDDQNLIEKMVLEIEDDEINKEKTKNKDKKKS